MKYSKLFIVLLVALLCVPAFGQEKYENKWFGGAGGGMNFGADGLVDRSVRKFSQMGAGTGIDAWIGKRFNDNFGLAVGYQGLNISKRFVEYGQFPYNYFHADALLMSSRYIMPYLHAGFLKADKNSAAGGVGVKVPIPVSDVLSVVPDFKATLFGDKAIGGTKTLGSNLSATLGLAVNLAKPRPKKVEPVYIAPEPEPEPQPEPEPVIVPEPEPEPEPVNLVEKSEEFTSRIAGITLFDFDKSFIRAEAFPVLDDIAAWMIENPEHGALIEGYTDYKGSDAYNLGLSQRRADSVKKYLVDKGVAAERLEAIGRGKGKFTEGTTDAEKRQMNRRVVITLR